MRKLSEINESVWGDLRQKSLGLEARGEDGKKVTTCLGIDVILKKPDSLYDLLIRDILARTDTDCSVGIVSPRDLNLSPDEMKNVRNWEAPYKYLIYDGLHGISLIANFYDYEDLAENDPSYKNDFPEEDYKALCKCVATKLKEIGDCLTYVPRYRTSVLDGTRNDIDEYVNEEQLKLIDESDVYNWEIEHGDEYNNPFGNSYLDDFKESIINEFTELEDEHFMYWSYNNYGGCSIAIPLSLNNVMNIKKYREFTQKWFNV